MTHQFITSGMLEAYLLGLTTDEEKGTVEQLIASNSDLAIHLAQLDAELETHFLHQSVPPPPAIRDVIELRVSEQRVQKREPQAYTYFDPQTAHNGTAAKPHYVDVEVDNTHIRVHKNWRPAFIAVFVLSKVLLAASLYYYFKADSQAQEIVRLKAEINHAATK